MFIKCDKLVIVRYHAHPAEYIATINERVEYITNMSIYRGFQFCFHGCLKTQDFKLVNKLQHLVLLY